MSDGKIDENISTSLIENGDKEDETLNNSASDGEIFDDDEPEQPKMPSITFSHRKIPKNFRPRHEKSDSDDESGKSLTFSRFRNHSCAISLINMQFAFRFLRHRQEERNHRWGTEEAEGAH